MPRKRTRRVAEVKQRLIERIVSDYFLPGDRFLSNRFIAATYQISYQTVCRIIQELADEGYLQIRPASGAYISGRMEQCLGVQFVFHERAKRKDSFGQRILKSLIQRLQRLEIPYTITYLQGNQDCLIDEEWYPVLWETEHLIESLVKQKRFCLLINARPKPGVVSTFVDSISLDDFSGGVTAGEVLRENFSISNPAVLAGPQSDLRSIARVQGFLSQYPYARVWTAGSWDYRDGYKTFQAIAPHQPDALFCCNDRLASAAVSCVFDMGFRRIPIIGFDDAPVSQLYNISTISIPWSELSRIGTEVVKKRLQKDTSSTINYILITRPLIRGGCVEYGPVQSSKPR